LPAAHHRAKPHPLSHWIDDIKRAWGRGAANTLELASIVNQARRSLEYGQWSDLWRSSQMPFSKRKADMLVAIGEGVENLDEHISAHLPMGWNILYYLARMGRREIERLVRQGRIHSGLSIRQAKALLAAYQHQGVPKTPRPNVKQRLDRFAGFVQKTVAEWSNQERVYARKQLRTLLKHISRQKNLPAPNIPAISPVTCIKHLKS
jgi:hypothetical protein